MQKADYWLRLMKQRTDALVATDEKLQQFLMWVNEKSLSVKVPYNPATVRAFYLDLELAILERKLHQDPTTFFLSGLTFTLDQELTIVILEIFLERGDEGNTPNLNQARVCDFAVDFFLARVLTRCLTYEPPHAIYYSLNYAIDLVVEHELQKILQSFKDEIRKYFCTRMIDNYKTLAEPFRNLIVKYRKIGYDWQFSYQQKQALKQYYDVNKLLVDCLNSGSNVTPAVRSHIEETLLLPIALIEKTGSCRNK